MDNFNEQRENFREEPAMNQGNLYGENGRGAYVYGGRPIMEKPKKKFPGWAKAIIVIALVLVFLVFIGRSCTKALNGSLGSLIGENGTDVVAGNFNHNYIGVLHIETTISEAGETSLYNHRYLLNSIDDMIDDNKNKGIILYVDTPGGSVYASDELYFKILEYKERTGRPVYSSMQSMAASGGYYISAPCDKIYANRNCWTGSIGVTIGTLYDVSGLLDKLGVKTQAITSGPNKAMGSMTEPLSKEQKEIFQSLVDEAYEQFTDIVAKGRNIPLAKVKALADGRIYTAKQAKKLNLIDNIGTFEDAVADMRDNYNLGKNCYIEDFVSSDKTNLLSSLGINANSMLLGNSVGEIEKIVGMNGKFEVSYMSNIQK